MGRFAMYLHGLSKQTLAGLKAVERRLRWSLGVNQIIVVVALVNTALYHLPLFSFTIANLDYLSPNGLLTLATMLTLVTAVTILLLSLAALVSVRLVKPLCMLFILGNSLALYFIDSYGVVLDKSMMGNVVNTNVIEAGSFFHPKLLLYVLMLGVLPCYLLLRVQLQAVRRLLVVRFMVFSLVISVGWIYAGSRSWLWVDKNASKLGGMILPWSYVFNAARHGADQLQASREQTLLPPASFAANEKTIVVLVIGEAARARNFSLYGYQRPTNPLLAAAGVVALPATHACATYTTAAVNCMLSAGDNGRQYFTAFEALPSYLQRQGVEVIWRTRNWGEPPLKVQSYQRAEELYRTCEGDGCDYDEVLLNGLEQRLHASASNKIFVVLHQHGSHGPDYYHDYPARFAVFQPVCQSVELADCANENLVNAYDNTILYTDYFLHRVIVMLKSFPETATMLMYVSDHGESLGEHGLYLHGTPYAIAPAVQKDIPFLVWMSEAYKSTRTIPDSELAPQRSHSQANVFHSVMGAFDMRSDIYNPRLDIFSDDSK